MLLGNIDYYLVASQRWSPDTDEATCLHDMLAAQTEDPSIAASRRLDWSPLVTSIAGPVLAVLLCLVEGQDLTKLVRMLK